MRLLHTSDWHVGATINRQSRYEETEAVLAEIAEIADDRDVDAVLLAGDLYDHKSPSATAEDVVYRALLRFEQVGVPVVMVPGNHDNPGRWEAVQQLLDRFDLHVVPEARRPEEGGIVELDIESGRLQVAALPWIGVGRLTGAQELMAPDQEPHSEYAEGMGSLMQALCEPLDPDAVNVLMSHAFVSGSVPSGSERGLTVGDTYAVPPQQLPNVQYVALGHVHQAQEVSGAPSPARYAGSVFQQDFGEAGEEKSVTLVEAEPRKPVSTEVVPLTGYRRLRQVHGTFEELEARADELEEDYLKVRLKCEKPQPGMAAQVRDILPNAIEVRLDYPDPEGERRETRLQELPDREQFRQYHQERYDSEPDDEMLDLFQELVQEATGETDAST